MEKIILVNVKTNSKKEKVVEIEENSFEIHVTSQPVKGAANKDIIKIIARHFNISKSNISIIKGNKSKIKTIKIST